MSTHSLIGRFSEYVNSPHSEAIEASPAVDDIVNESEQVPVDDESLSASWSDLKHGFGALRERLMQTRAEVRAIGRLAVLDVDGAAAALSAPETDELSTAKPQSMREFIQERVEGIRYDAENARVGRKIERKRKIRKIKSQAPWYAAAICVSATVGYLSAKGH